ncbi:hypothetical protein KSP39_PZI014716 [Platanthera zijinensis]|uniref:Peptidase S8/S53 domain-containing protein n=1 Tax=Platanthera zijinensis TaxID=2320716 RepID=A0AAP0BAH1_9ASPA
MSGFATHIMEEAFAMSSIPEFLAACRNQNHHPMTTRTLAFLGLQPNAGLWCQSNRGEGVIIGVVNTGVGARAFYDVFATNTLGHETHTACTTGGNFFSVAEFLGQASGTASNIAPLTHLAVYKICSSEGCNDDHLVAGLHAAIEDCVDVVVYLLEASLFPFRFYPIAIAGLHVFLKGITFACSAGNSGPKYGSLSYETPWLISVGSLTLDRVLKAIVRLGDDLEFVGEALFQPKGFSYKH